MNARIVTAAAELGTQPFPSGAKKLSGCEHTYRVRIGDYRIIYEVIPSQGLITVQRVRYRKDVYRN
jgi:mRNA interferase RelE/StbE